jgi:hypothetical protein
MDKTDLYYKGWYRFSVPPVHTQFWEVSDWIHWIDNHGEWLPNNGLIPYFMPEWLRKLGVILKDDGRHFDAGTRLDPL